LKPTFRLGAAALVVACWLSAGSAPFADAVRGASAPGDWARDYVTARARLEAGRGPPPVGEAGNDRAARYGVPRVGLYGAPYFIHPPTATLAILPLASLPWRAAALGWAAASVIALGWLAFSLLGIWSPQAEPRAGRVALLTLALALWPPTLHCLEKGQWSIWLAAWLASGLRSLEAGRPRRAGVAFGVAAALKLTPIVMLGFLLVRNRRAALALVATTAGAALVALAAIGPAAWKAFLAEAPHNAAVWAPWIANTASLDGVYARLLTANPFSRPIFLAPGLAGVAFGLTELMLLAAAIAATYRNQPAEAPADARILAAWLTLPVLLNPLGWSHVVLMLLAPLAVLTRDAQRRTRIGVVLVLAALSVPRQRLAEWAGAVPVGPGGGTLLGLHALAALGLFGMLLLGPYDGPRGAPRTSRRGGFNLGGQSAEIQQ
jgi:uncharacterized membrane protein